MSQNITPIQKILVANRGEIAIRVLRAASELKIRTVAIYTFEDRYSLHRYKADEAYRIGAKDDPLKPYLDIEEIISTAKTHGVNAIHPGYGFLSENVNFARRCREEGIIFIGPEPEVMDQLGDKVAAKNIARAAEVPLIEDSQKELANDQVILEEARRIGFPIMVKAVSGGGGRGMRVVRNEAELLHEAHEAKGEALTAFGDDTIFLERYIENPKHIEIQILGDKHGNLVHLFERDCSVQRRFQKVVEIAPSLTLKESTRQALFDYALKITRHVNYTHAGTVEFLVDKEENIFFIEVNPRIQVEHTITEEVTGIDIVRSQILIAQGYPLSHPEIRIANQQDIQCHGYAIQCRVTTENPNKDFKPDYGTLIAYRSANGFGIRLDAGSAYAGAKISPFFDSLLVKVTAWGRELPEAASRLHRTLREFRVRGVQTNLGFLLNLLQNETFQKGEATVNFIAEHPDGGAGRGTDNVKQFRKWNQVLAEEQNRSDYPCYVLAPQANQLWNEVHLSNIKDIIKDLSSVDMNRVYILGHSMGGHGTYILTQLDPDYFAAAAPSAGSGRPETEKFIDVSVIKDIPFWIFHGDQDKTCPIENDQKVFAEMQKIGGNMKFTTWKGDGHGVSVKFVAGSDNGTTQFSNERCDPEPVLLKWLFNQKLSGK